MWFSYSICHVAGKYLYTADTLSGAPLSHPEAADVLEEDLTECFVNKVLASLPASSDTLHHYRTAQRGETLSASNCSPYICREG